MAPVGPLAGSLTASTSSGNTSDLIANLGIDGCTLDISAASGDATIDGSIFAARRLGLYEWTITAPFKYPPTPQHGLNPTGSYISQTNTGLYLTGVKDFSITLQVGFAPSTDDQATTAMTFGIAEPWSLSGTYTANVDHTVALKLPARGDAAVFKIGDETTTNDIITADVVVTGVQVNRARGQITSVTVSFEGDGDIECDGDTGLLTTDVNDKIVLPTADTLVVTHSSGKTATGSAIVQSVTISRSTSEIINGTATFRGTGALTMA